MHRQDAFGRQQEVKVSEHRLLDFSGIARAADEHDLAAEIESDDSLRTASVPLRISSKGGQIDNCKVGGETSEFRLRRTDQQIADERRMAISV